MATRLYIAQSLTPGALITLDEPHAHYVRHVMRLGDGETIHAFNGEQGEWEAHVQLHGKRAVQLAIGKQLSAPRPSPDIALAFALIKNKSELVVEKATELGVREIHAIVTQHAVVKNVNLEKLEAHAIEAAEQCERHDIPTITPHKDLAHFLGNFPAGRILLYGDESGKGSPLPGIPTDKPVTILIGPEGGFSAEEHRILQAASFAQGFGMGPRILRADTAAVVALACIVAQTGDWNERPHFKGKA